MAQIRLTAQVKHLCLVMHEIIITMLSCLPRLQQLHLQRDGLLNNKEMVTNVTKATDPKSEQWLCK
jgi:hypothetical protein